MSDSPVYDLLQKMDGDNIVLAYKGEINADLLEAVYSMMDKHLEEKKESPAKKKKFFHILTECLQNVFHHQSTMPEEFDGKGRTGFAIKSEDEHTYQIITGNYILNSAMVSLKKKIDEVNSLSPEDLRTHYRKSLEGNEFSDKGGAGLGIIEMARKSGKKLDYSFTKVNDNYSFFSLTITIP